MNGTFHWEGGKQHPNPCMASSTEQLPCTATIAPLAPSSPPKGVQRLHCTPQTCRSMRSLAQAVNWDRWGVMDGSPSSARVEPNWSSCASSALTVPCPIPGRTPAQSHLSQSADVWSKVWGSQACPLSLCQGCWARLASFFPRPKWQRLPFLCVLILSPLSVSIKAQPGHSLAGGAPGRAGLPAQTWHTPQAHHVLS